jgi:FkbM family methyltransferase
VRDKRLICLLRPFKRAASRLAGPVIQRLSRAVHYPYVVSLDAINENGCRFEITTEIEAYRVEEYGEEREFTALIVGALGPKAVLYDIGANIGLVTVHSAHKCAHVVAFEPDSDYRARLVRNLQLNKLTNVQVVEWAVSDRQGKAVLFRDKAKGLPFSSPIMANWPGRKATREVPTDTIDNALRRGVVLQPDVIKIDIEGAEMAALQGMRGLLTSDRAPVIFIEVHPEFLGAFGSSSEEVVRFLKSCGYQAYYENERSDQIHYVFGKAGHNPFAGAGASGNR